MAERWKPYGHTSGNTIVPKSLMRTFVPSFNRPVWASQEQSMNLGKNTFPYRLTSGMQNLLVFPFSCIIVGFTVTNNICCIFPGYPPADHEVRDFLTMKGTEDEYIFELAVLSTLCFSRPTIHWKISSIRSWELRKWLVDSEYL